MGGQSHTPSGRYMIALSADFEPEDYPGLIELSFLTDEGGSFGAGLYELRFVRTLTEDERVGSDAMRAAIRKATGADQ